MHHCLTVPELVNEIASHCDQPSQAILARTARLFDCALDALWADILLRELILCFSSEVVKSSPPSSRPFLTLVNHPEPRHWDRFHFYGKRVKDIQLHTRGVDDAFIDLLCLRAPQGELLPCLHTCSLQTSHLWHLQLLRPFISPTLKNLCFLVDGEEGFLGDPVLTSFFASLPNRCPELMRLTVDWHSRDYFPDFPVFLQSFQNLQELEIGNVYSPHFPVIASLPRLTSLTMDCWERGATLSQEPVTNMFRFLQYLHVTSPINSLRSLFRYIAKSPMEDIRLVIEDDARIGLDTIFLALHDTCERSTLRTLEIQANTYPLERVPVTNGDSLSRLFDFPNIIEFICPLGMVAVSDHHISMLARSWPKLTSLDANGDGSTRSGGSLPTIKSLDFLVRHCPLLRNLSISFNAMNIDFDAESIPADGASNRLVTELDVGDSPMSRAPSVAIYLCSLFPSLQTIHWGDNSRDVFMWEHVERIIPILNHGGGLAVRAASRNQGQGMKAYSSD